jgi:hypothetical protein
MRDMALLLDDRVALCAFDVEGRRMLVSDCCAMISETRDSVTDETVALIPVVEHFIGPARS